VVEAFAPKTGVAVRAQYSAALNTILVTKDVENSKSEPWKCLSYPLGSGELFTRCASRGSSVETLVKNPSLEIK
jgi:hypothetical protein